MNSAFEIFGTSISGVYSKIRDKSLPQLLDQFDKKLIRKLWVSQRTIIAIDKVSVAVGSFFGTLWGTRVFPIVLIAPPGGGNVGDQALVEACDLVLGSRQLTVVGDRSAFCGSIGRDSIILPGLFYGSLPRHWLSLGMLAARVQPLADLHLIGADILDGKYNCKASELRLTTLVAFQSSGSIANIVGFSWNENPNPRCSSALRILDSRGGRIHARDPISLDRLNSDGVSGARPAADIVFVDNRRVSQLSGLVNISASERFALINVSAMIGYDHLGADYKMIAAGLLNNGLIPVLVPHVSRRGSDDFETCAELAAELGSNCRMLQRLPTPKEVRRLASSAELVITGRMHLAVMALSVQTPAIALETQGKVEGLMKLFGVTDMCVYPAPGMGEEVLYLISELMSNNSRRDAVTQNIDSVRKLALSNF